MACALDIDPINQLEENLQCSVCLEVLTDPRTLPCCHSFCKHCLERIVETCRDEARGQPIREFPCPNCRAKFILHPDKHVADMPRNHFICNMVKATAVLDRGIGVPCSHNCSQSYSVVRCVTCEKFLCKECLTAHNNYRGTNGHSVLTMEELSKPENRKKINDKMYCNEHSGMDLKVYCETCDKLICRDCMDFKHVKQGHSCLLVKDVANKYKELLASNNQAMEEALIEGNVFLERLTLTTEQLDRDAENIKIQIAQKKDVVLKTVTEMLEEKTKTLLKKVDDMQKAERAEIEKQEKTKLYVEKIKTSVQLSKRLVDQGTEEEIISSQKMMLNNANNLLRNRKEYFEAPIPGAKLSYTSTGEKTINEDILKKLKNSLGQVDEEKKDTEIDVPIIKEICDNVKSDLTVLRDSEPEPEPTELDTSEPTRRVPVPAPKPRYRKTTILTADIDLDLYHYLKDYQPAQWSLALKDPQPKIELKEESASFTFSTQDAKEHFLNEMKDYKSEIVPVNPALLKQGLSEKLKEIILVFSSGKSVSFIERYNECFIKLVGKAVPTFDLAINKVKECIAEVEEKTN